VNKKNGKKKKSSKEIKLEKKIKKYIKIDLIWFQFKTFEIDICVVTIVFESAFHSEIY
jgi:hypothetical protein